MEPLSVLGSSPNRRLNQGDLMLCQQTVVFGTPIPAIGEERLPTCSCIQIGQRLPQQRAVIRVVWGSVNLGDQLHRVLQVTGLTYVEHRAPLPLSPLLLIGHFQVIRRLKTAGDPCLACLDLTGIRVQAEVHAKHLCQHLLYRRVAGASFQFVPQATPLFPNALQGKR